jgi:adenylate cyclase
VEFETDAQRSCYETIQGWVQQMFGESAATLPDQAAFSLPLGTAGVVVSVQAMGEDEACVDLWTWPISDGAVGDDGLRRMLEMNAGYRFGALNLQSNGSVVFEYVVHSPRSTSRRSARSRTCLAVQPIRSRTSLRRI